MISINYLYKTKDGSWHEATKEFSCPYNALRFIKAIQSYGNKVVGFTCLDPEDFEWLSARVKLN